MRGVGHLHELGRDDDKTLHAELQRVDVALQHDQQLVVAVQLLEEHDVERVILALEELLAHRRGVAHLVGPEVPALDLRRAREEDPVHAQRPEVRVEPVPRGRHLLLFLPPVFASVLAIVKRSDRRSPNFHTL